MTPCKATLSLLLFTALLSSVTAVAVGSQPNPPIFPDTVAVFSPGDSDITTKVNAAYTKNGGHSPGDNGQFSSDRFAFLFMPGEYTEDIPVGFYTTVAGLGSSPDDVVFSGARGVYCEEGDYYFEIGALDTFWRAAENFKTTSSYNWQVGSGMMWAVSQAAPLRRVHVMDELLLFEYQPPYGAAGFASGGYVANSRVEGNVVSGSQQQFLARNLEMAGWPQGVWNMVFVGCTGAPQDSCGLSPAQFVVEATTPKHAEKPFMSVDPGSKLWYLNVPPVQLNTQGTQWGNNGVQIPFSSVFVADPSMSAATINQALAEGLHVVMSPGIYQLDQALLLNTDNQVLLGLGFPTLVPTSGNPTIQVGAVDGVRIAGPFLLQAGANATESLLDWGTAKAPYAGNADSPGFLYDVFARVGGPDAFPVQADTMVRLYNGNVIGDNSWFWRADHTVSGEVKNCDNPSQHGLQVFADDVTYYGLAVEHTLQDLVQWNGNNGKVYFYQSELPYDVTQAQFGDKGYAGYVVAPSVTSHFGMGVGVYHFFRDYAVTVESGIVAPSSPGVTFQYPLTVFLNGKGRIEHVLNGEGNATYSNKAHNAYLC